MRATITVAMALALVAACAIADGPAAAQSSGVRDGAAAPQRRVRRVAAQPRIVVTPAQRLYRRCVDTYVVENRPTGPTVVPDMRCWWTYR